MIDQSAKTQIVVDGLGAQRIAEVLDLTPGEHLRLRPANKDDIVLYFNWVNDPAVRCQAIHAEPILWAQHTKWFTKKLADTRSRLFVLQDGALPVGQIRFDRDGDVARIDYSLDVLARGRHWAARLISMGAHMLQGNTPINLLAEVKATNAASCAAFMRLGFEEQTALPHKTGMRVFRLLVGTHCNPVRGNGAMTHNKEFSDELLERATDSNYLAKRLEMNTRFQTHDFNAWVIDHLAPHEDMRVLDVGCGRGAQAIPVSHVIGGNGTITFIDLSPKSVMYVKENVNKDTQTNGISGSMDDLDNLLEGENEPFDLAYSVYALYYSKDPSNVMRNMYQHLRPGGRLCIVGPEAPHGMVEIARNFHPIPPQVDDSFEFRSKVVEPFFKEYFSTYRIFCLKNPQSINDPDAFIRFYRQTTYYVADAENDLRTFAAEQISEKGELVFSKYSYAVIAEKD